MICNVDKEYIMKLIESSSSPQLTTAHKSGNSSDKFLSKLKNSVDSVLKRLSLNNKSQYVLFEPKNYDGVEYKDDEDMPKSESSNSLDGVEYKDDEDMPKSESSNSLDGVEYKDDEDMPKSESSNSLDGVEYKDDEDMPKSESSNSLDEQINNDGVEYKDDDYVIFIQSIGSFSGTRSLSCSSSVGSKDSISSVNSEHTRADSISSFNSEHTRADVFPVGQTILGTL
jgi:hypothetical protein